MIARLTILLLLASTVLGQSPEPNGGRTREAMVSVSVFFPEEYRETLEPALQEFLRPATEVAARLDAAPELRAAFAKGMAGEKISAATLESLGSATKGLLKSTVADFILLGRKLAFGLEQLRLAIRLERLDSAATKERMALLAKTVADESASFDSRADAKAELDQLMADRQEAEGALLPNFPQSALTELRKYSDQLDKVYALEAYRGAMKAGNPLVNSTGAAAASPAPVSSPGAEQR